MFKVVYSHILSGKVVSKSVTFWGSYEQCVAHLAECHYIADCADRVLEYRPGSMLEINSERGRLVYNIVSK